MKRILGTLTLSIFLLMGAGAARTQETQKPPGMQQAQQPSQKPPDKQQPQRPTQKPQKKAAMQTFLGVISDGQCGASHTAVMKKASVNSVANCVKGCAHRHGFVLYDPAAKKVYKLSDQERPAELAGKRVKITGALDKNTQTIYVSSIVQR